MLLISESSHAAQAMGPAMLKPLFLTGTEVQEELKQMDDYILV